jgi:hypothetical protein
MRKSAKDHKTHFILQILQFQATFSIVSQIFAFSDVADGGSIASYFSYSKVLK